MQLGVRALTFEIPKELYNKTVVLKAAYLFTDRAYIYIQQTDANYVLNIKLKPGVDEITADEFKNELLAQAVRYELFEQTKDVRKLIAMRALATAIVGEVKDVIEPQKMYTEDEILKDCFENENT
jgi:His-Xaa-Ser system protein HxsD